MSNQDQGDNNDDPFAEDPELEFAQTVAMTAIPGPGPGASGDDEGDATQAMDVSEALQLDRQRRDAAGPQGPGGPGPQGPGGPGPAGPQGPPGAPQGPGGMGGQSGPQPTGMAGPGGPNAPGGMTGPPGPGGPQGHGGMAGPQGPGGPQMQGGPGPQMQGGSGQMHGGPGPQMHGGPGPQMQGGPGPQMQPRPGMAPQAGPAKEKKFGVSSVLSILGGLALVVSFFMPIISGGQIFEDIFDDLKDSSLIAPEVIFADDAEPPEGMEKEFEISKSIFETLEFEQLMSDLKDAEDEDEVAAIQRNYRLSAYQMMELMRVVHSNADMIGIPSDEAPLVGVFWLYLAWTFLVVGLVAVLLALIRGFKPLNAFQVGWNGLYGLVVLLMGLSMFISDETKEVGGVSVQLFDGMGMILILVAGILLWVSAFAGLTSKNWWKAPLFAILALVIQGGLISGAAYMLVG